MDPNAKLERLRKLAHDWLSEKENDYDFADEMASGVEELDEWLSSGGFPPDAWVKNAHYNHPSSYKDTGVARDAD